MTGLPESMFGLTRRDQLIIQLHKQYLDLGNVYGAIDDAIRAADIILRNPPASEHDCKPPLNDCKPSGGVEFTGEVAR